MSDIDKTADENFVHDYNEEYTITKLKAELEKERESKDLHVFENNVLRKANNELKAELSKAQEKIKKLKAKLEIATGNAGLYDDNATDSA